MRKKSQQEQRSSLAGYKGEFKEQFAITAAHAFSMTGRGRNRSPTASLARTG